MAGLTVRQLQDRRLRIASLGPRCVENAGAREERKCTKTGAPRPPLEAAPACSWLWPSYRLYSRRVGVVTIIRARFLIRPYLLPSS
jgi:hypothetical protein